MNRKFLLSHSMLTMMSFLAIGLAAFITSSCVKTASGRRALILVPQGKMLTLGAQAYQEMRQKSRRSRNTRLISLVRKIGMDIARASGQNYKWEFELFEDPKQINAFCLPGGKVGVYSGILPVARTNAGLAAIMGHEVAHAVLRHGAERMSQQMALKGVMSLGSIVFGNSKYKGAIMGAMGLGAKFGVMLPYSRSHESEADRMGLMYMAKAGYNPKEAVSLWVRMAQQGKTPPELVSTHPNPIKRSKALNAQISSVVKYYRAAQRRRTFNLPLR
ncbi:MAG: M48 family peptidase [Deltaproteobacteria bacterium]|nr:MAG: M48 family peptidase [Deltaproteobacteria bacterium]